jgi:hypothetical protein
MNALATHWKLFAACLLVGLVAALGLRAALSGPVEEPPREQEATAIPAPEASGLLVDLGNENCPVMGGAVDGKTYEEWNHLRVGYCCPGCDRKFLVDPEGVLDDAGIEWREAAAAVKKYRDASSEHKAHALAAIEKRWKVVRR